MAPGPALQATLETLSQTPQLSLSGLVGYEPHLAKLPKLAGWPGRAKSATQKIYGEALAQSGDAMGARHVKSMVRNMAGSPTFRMYKDTKLANELAAGSTLVKPSDFDTPLLKPFVPAAFIATPALKVENGVRVPGGEQAGDLLEAISPGTSVFTHGGYWIIKWGISVSRTISSFIKPSASERRRPVSLIMASRWRFGSSIAAHAACNSLIVFTGMVGRVFTLSSEGMNIFANGLVFCIPCSWMAKETIDRIEAKHLFTEEEARPLLIKWSRKLAASAEVSSLIEISPLKTANCSMLRRAVRSNASPFPLPLRRR